MRYLLALALVLSCKPSEVSYPDDDKVASAQKKWCAALAKVSGAEWQHQSECEAARPSGSAPFLGSMAGCYQRRHEELGDNAPDSGALVSDCTETVLTGAEPGNVNKSAVVQARCERNQRCDELSIKNCLATFNELDGMQRAIFTSLYNLRAQSDIARCLDDSECGPEPEDSCFKQAYEKRVWLPFSLTPDMSTAPIGAQ